MLANVAQSATRTVAIGKYLVALSGSFTDATYTAEATSTSKTILPARRQRLNVLYLLNDSIHHIKFHDNSSPQSSTMITSLEPYLSKLIALASAYKSDLYPKHQQKIQDLLDLWRNECYYQPSVLHSLSQTATDAAALVQVPAQVLRRRNSASDDVVDENKKTAPFFMPASHGDSSTPFYDLPAANLIPHIIPNSTNPINPQSVRPLQLATGPANATLITAVKKFLLNIDKIDGENVQSDDPVEYDIDDLGHMIIYDKDANKSSEGEGYYGWSWEFCEKMKRGDDVEDFGNINKLEGDRNVSSGCHKRRRYSVSIGSDRTQSPSRSPSRTRSRERIHNFRGRSRSRSRSLSYSPPQAIQDLDHLQPAASQQPSYNTSRGSQGFPTAEVTPPHQLQSQPYGAQSLSNSVHLAQGLALGLGSGAMPQPAIYNGPPAYDVRYGASLPQGHASWRPPQSPTCGTGTDSTQSNLSSIQPLHNNYGAGMSYGRGGFGR